MKKQGIINLSIFLEEIKKDAILINIELIFLSRYIYLKYELYMLYRILLFKRNIIFVDYNYLRRGKTPFSVFSKKLIL